MLLERLRDTLNVSHQEREKAQKLRFPLCINLSQQYNTEWELPQYSDMKNQVGPTVT